ncbi:hypothetical protein ACFL0F_02345 [Patescibacteria group bacterium]
MKLINLTPHTLNIFDMSGKQEIIVLPASGSIARYTDNEKYISKQKLESVLIPTYRSIKPGVLYMPKKKDNVIYVVSTPVRIVLKHRKDIASPGELIRNNEGQPIGCKGLIFN